MIQVALTGVLIAMAGTGLAAAMPWMTSQHLLYQQASAGTIGLAWNNEYNTTSNGTFCRAGGIGPTSGVSFTITVGLWPGDYCVATGDLTNTGSGNLTLWTTPYSGSINGTCFYFLNNIANDGSQYTGSIGPAANGVTYSFPAVEDGSVTLMAGATFHLQVAVGMWSDAPSGCAGQTDSYTLNVYGATPSGNGP